MLDSLVRVSRRAARDDAKAEPTLASRFALAVVSRSPIGRIAPKTRPAVAAEAHIPRSTGTRPKTAPAQHGSKDHDRQ